MNWTITSQLSGKQDWFPCSVNKLNNISYLWTIFYYIKLSHNCIFVYFVHISFSIQFCTQRLPDFLAIASTNKFWFTELFFTCFCWLKFRADWYTDLAPSIRNVQMSFYSKYKINYLLAWTMAVNDYTCVNWNPVTNVTMILGTSPLLQSLSSALSLTKTWSVKRQVTIVVVHDAHPSTPQDY